MWGAACWLSWAGMEPLPELCLVLSMCDCMERRMGPGERRLVLCPLGCSPPRSFLIVSQQKWLSFILVINTWFYFSGFSCLSSILTCYLVLRFASLASLPGRSAAVHPSGFFWHGRTDPAGQGLEQSDQDMCRCPPLSASACLSLLLSAASLIRPLLFSKHGCALVEAAAGEELWLSCAQTRTWIKKKLVYYQSFALGLKIWSGICLV